MESVKPKSVSQSHSNVSCPDVSPVCGTLASVLLLLLLALLLALLMHRGKAQGHPCETPSPSWRACLTPYSSLVYYNPTHTADPPAAAHSRALPTPLSTLRVEFGDVSSN